MEYTVINVAGQYYLKFSILSENIVRVQISVNSEDFPETGLNKYGFISDSDLPFKEKLDMTRVDSSEGINLQAGKFNILVSNKDVGKIFFRDRRTNEIFLHQDRFELTENGGQIFFKASDNENWCGFGDQVRDRLFHRGYICDLHVRNVKSYIPVPFFMSTCDYGVLVNTTYRVIFDMCKSEGDTFGWWHKQKFIDYYVIRSEGFKSIIDDYTKLTGRPKLPPLWSFGLWYIARTQANDYEVVNDGLNFRREQIPCDVISLEPGWMDKYYDTSTDKKWSDERFPIPKWAFTGPHNFIDALKRMGYKLGLWLCCEYDLSYEQERKIGNEIRREHQSPEFHQGAELDTHFSWPRYADEITKPDQPWFEHLKKFVNQGADFFKLDGAYQVCDHPDRVWGNGMLDEEMHNLYPLLLSQQMWEGFAKHTSRRPVVFTVAGWVGFQSWCGTWTGDTGGKIDTLGGMLNTAMVGHSWCTNDMEVAEPEGIHMGYLLPWSQINSWCYFRMPWVQGTKLCNMHKYYANLRARLIYYFYSWAYYATQNGCPLIRPLVLEFEDDENTYNLQHQYLLGRDILVIAYKKDAYFPSGKWKDYWTGRIVEGRSHRQIDWPADRGGGLYIREGAIIPFIPILQYREEESIIEAINLYVFPKLGISQFQLYEDDGVSFEYEKGIFKKTEIKTNFRNSKIKIEIEMPVGRYQNYATERRWSFVIAVTDCPKRVYVDDKMLPSDKWYFDNKRNELIVSESISLSQLVVEL